LGIGGKKMEVKNFEERLEENNKIVKKYTWYSIGAGIIPVPFVDLAALSGVQLKMLWDLSAQYNIEFSQNKAQNIISTLAGTLAASATSTVVGSVIKFVPVIGTILGTISMPAFSGASTYALGKVFIQHFESGGTLLTFDPTKVREYYKEMFAKGQEIYEESKKK